jgi:arylsulfatase A
LIVNWPKSIAPGSVSEDLVGFSDWLPTVAEIGRAKLPKEVKFDGQSFGSSFRGKNESARDFAFAESKGGRAFVRDQRYKLYANGKFYDISIDQEERKPLAKGEATKSRKRLENAIREIGYGK